jgi:hypothetical protein
MVNWAYVQETRMNFAADILDDVHLEFTAGGSAVLTVMVRLDNSDSRLDVELVEISFDAYSDPEKFLEQSVFIGQGSRGFEGQEDAIVPAGETADLEASLGIFNGTLYMEKLLASEVDGRYPIHLKAVVRYKLAEFPGINDKSMDIWRGPNVEPV